MFLLCLLSLNSIFFDAISMIWLCYPFESWPLGKCNNTRGKKPYNFWLRKYFIWNEPSPNESFTWKPMFLSLKALSTRTEHVQLILIPQNLTNLFRSDELHRAQFCTNVHVSCILHMLQYKTCAIVHYLLKWLWNI